MKANEWHKIGFSYPLPNQKVYAYVEDNSSLIDDVTTYYTIECFLEVHSQKWRDKTFYYFKFWTPNRDFIFGSVTHYSFEFNPEELVMEGFIFNHCDVCINPIVEPTEKKHHYVRLAQIGDYWLSGYNYKTQSGGGGSPVSFTHSFKTKQDAIQYARKQMDIGNKMQLELF